MAARSTGAITSLPPARRLLLAPAWQGAAGRRGCSAGLRHLRRGCGRAIKPGGVPDVRPAGRRVSKSGSDESAEQPCSREVETLADGFRECPAGDAIGVQREQVAYLLTLPAEGADWIGCFQRGLAAISQPLGQVV